MNQKQIQVKTGQRVEITTEGRATYSGRILGYMYSLALSSGEKDTQGAIVVQTDAGRIVFINVLTTFGNLRVVEEDQP